MYFILEYIFVTEYVPQEAPLWDIHTFFLLQFSTVTGAFMGSTRRKQPPVMPLVTDRADLGLLRSSSSAILRGDHVIDRSNRGKKLHFNVRTLKDFFFYYSFRRNYLRTVSVLVMIPLGCAVDFIFDQIIYIAMLPPPTI